MQTFCRYLLLFSFLLSILGDRPVVDDSDFVRCQGKRDFSEASDCSSSSQHVEQSNVEDRHLSRICRTCGASDVCYGALEGAAPHTWKFLLCRKCEGERRRGREGGEKMSGNIEENKRNSSSYEEPYKQAGDEGVCLGNVNEARGKREAEANTTELGDVEFLPLAQRCWVCPRQASFGSIGSSLSQARHCRQHKLRHEVNVRQTSCIHQGCWKRAIYGDSRDDARGRRALRCAAHRLPDDMDLSHKLCLVSGCTRRPSFGRRQGAAEKCWRHKEPDMTDVKNRRCLHLEGCSRRLHVRGNEGWEEGGGSEVSGEERAFVSMSPRHLCRHHIPSLVGSRFCFL
mmetsp:Transcript_25430/g.84114  ORF Transcript_25430/g.84114 Transcript_25430/m.84114 type:complete len:342 (-) Transcript_25430:1634-2659(-)